MGNNYYKAYDNRYEKVHLDDMLWASTEPTLEVKKFLSDYQAGAEVDILDLGCGEGRDAIYLLKNGYHRLLAVDYSKMAIKKCNELTNYKYLRQFRQLDLLEDKLDKKFKFIYSIAVLHMFVMQDHRDKYLKFIYEHLTDNGVALITVLGDGIKEYSSDVDKAFLEVDRVVMNNNRMVKVAATSCKVVNFETLEEELNKNGLKIDKKWISKDIPEFTSSMCVVVRKRMNK